MAQPRSVYHSIAGHEIHVSEWGDPEAPAVVMWHGLARVGRDFDTVAAHLAPLFHVICPDTVGRGLSSWSARPEQDYLVPAYCAHAVELLDRLGIASARWVGSSMGGIIGMALAGTPGTAGRVERLVVNDVGPVLNPPAVERIKAYAGTVPEFPTMERFEAFLRFAYAPFGTLTAQEWRRMAETSVRRCDNGAFSAHYDPAVMRVFADSIDGLDLWPLYDAIVCPTLVLRGESSDLLLPDVAEEMTRRGPRAQLVTISGCGHAPMLNAADQIAVLKGFLA
jgi:Predicted hydrolases or acyltransferases (alpha/beta hydrolase superfamily)